MIKFRSTAVLLLALSVCTMTVQATSNNIDENRGGAVVSGSVGTVMSKNAKGATYKNIDGTVQTLDILQPGVPTLAIFWASWCGTCLAEIPHIKKLQQAFPRLNIVGVNVNKDPVNGLRIQQEHTLSYASISDPDLVLADRFKVRGTPGFVLLGANGELKAKTNRLSKSLRKTIAQITVAHGEG